jgi:DNA-binding NtrC family response regulator
MTESQPVRVLIVEDNDSDAALVVRHLEQAGFKTAWDRVETEKDFVAALDPQLDVILADFNLPAFGAPRALHLLKARDIRVPLIVVSGSIGEERAVRVLQSGAADYLLKDRLARLGPAVQRVIDERRLETDKRKAELALRESEERTRFASVGGGPAHLDSSLVRDT